MDDADVNIADAEESDVGAVREGAAELEADERLELRRVITLGRVAIGKRARLLSGAPRPRTAFRRRGDTAFFRERPGERAAPDRGGVGGAAARSWAEKPGGGGGGGEREREKKEPKR